MTWFLTIVAVLIVLVLGILFLNRYYRKATREVALIRTGSGGQRVVLDGGCIALPFLHKITEINMRTSKLEIERLGPKSIITSDRLRVDVRFRIAAAALRGQFKRVLGKGFGKPAERARQYPRPRADPIG